MVNISRTIIVKKSIEDIPNNTMPTITLIGDSTVNLLLNQAYKELGYVAIDKEDGDLTDKVVITDNIDSSKVGTYKVYYRVIDKDNNMVSQVRDVQVLSNIEITNEKPMIELVGPLTDNLVIGQEYKELGYVAIDKEDGDLSDKVIITNNIDSSKVGAYFIYYKVVDSQNVYSDIKKRVVNYQESNKLESEKPILTLIGDNPYKIKDLKKYIDPGFAAIDKEDGNLTAKVIVSNNFTSSIPPYYVYYTLLDSTQNLVMAKREIIVDGGVNSAGEKPVITLKGPNTITINQSGGPYKELGAEALDAEDGDLTPYIIMTNNVQEKPGTFYATYRVIDSDNNVAIVVRTVIVE
jgi:hypothetical protein